MDYRSETSKFIALVNSSVKTENDISELIASISTGLGAVIYVNLDKSCHDELIAFIASDIKRSSIEAANDPGMVLMQTMKGVENGFEQIKAKRRSH